MLTAIEWGAIGLLVVICAGLIMSSVALHDTYAIKALYAQTTKDVQAARPALVALQQNPASHGSIIVHNVPADAMCWSYCNTRDNLVRYLKPSALATWRGASSQQLQPEQGLCVCVEDKDTPFS